MRDYIKCPDCNAGAKNLKTEFRQGMVGTAAREAKEEDECPRCGGDGIIIRPNPKDPTT